MYKKYRKIQRYFAHLLEPGTAESGLAKAVDVFITIIILLNITALVIDTVPDIPFFYKENFYFFELFTVVVFTLELCAVQYVQYVLLPCSSLSSLISRPVGTSGGLRS